MHDVLLSPFAQSAENSFGRNFLENTYSFRNCFQRDRDRIVHSSAFRRLEGKTQVFLSGQNDYYRTRLTHTIEVTSLSRTVARALHLNEDLSEAIALAHDLGHPPLGHVGEATLHHLMSNVGGFDHNEQSLRIVELLEESYPQYPGLNLSYEVLEGLRKHHRQFKTPDGQLYPSPSLEAQLVNIADEIAYYSHDLDDGLESGLLLLPALEELAVWQEAKQQAAQEIGALVGVKEAQKSRKFVLRCLINTQVEELIATSQKTLSKTSLSSILDVRKEPKHLISFSFLHKKKNAELRSFLYEHFYHHPYVATRHQEVSHKIEFLFQHFLKEPQLIGPHFFQRIESEGKERAICDYIAGMTDQYLHRRYHEINKTS